MEEDDEIKAELRNLSGQQFEDFFCDLMEMHHGSDFQRVRPYQGDGGVDGYLLDKEHIFACYGSQGGKAPAQSQTKKIKEDFAKAVKTAKNRPLGFQKWTFVHNHVDGLAISAVVLIKKLKKENPNIKIATFCFQEFKTLWKRKSFFSSCLQRPKQKSPKPKTELDWLLPEFQHIPLLGRDVEMKEYMAWLQDDKSPVAVRILTGAGGRGKTRFAWELCRKAVEKQWMVGFLGTSDLEFLLQQTDRISFEWYQPTLVVVDYAAFLAGDLNKWFSRLLSLPERKRLSLRILLLERTAKWEEGWCKDAFGGASFAAQGLFEYLNPTEPEELPQLSEIKFRHDFLEAVIKGLGSNKLPPKPGTDKQFDQQLEKSDWGGHPLYLFMAGILAAKNGFADLLLLNNVDLAMWLAKRELTRIERFAKDETGQLLKHLAAYVTLCEGLGHAELMAVVKEEKELLGYDGAAGRRAMVDLLQQVLPTPNGEGAAPVRPDMIGEALTILALDAKPTAKQIPVAARAMHYSQGRAIAAIIRCGQDFVYQGERQEPLNWLKSIIEHEDISLAMLITIDEQMPDYSLGLVELTAQIEARIVAILRDEIGGDEKHEKIAQLSQYLNNLSVRLSDLGLHDDAMEKAQEAEEIYRKLSKREPDVYLPDLANSLNNIANRYSDLGQKEAALAPAQEAEEIRRKLSKRQPDVYLPDLAMSLNNIANRYSDLGQKEAALALAPAQEAEDIYRKLSKRQPDVYLPKLALSLNTLAIRYSELGQKEAALAPAQEAVEKLSGAFFQIPLAYQPWMEVMVGNYRIYCSELNQVPDMELLEPILKKLDELKNK
ncbi:MAG: tetratricopeptide repeat protein [Magnetococcales bacterium]|nr:tetratricopeptide repeat protein [Magnetococcales bacterium]